MRKIIALLLMILFCLIVAMPVMAGSLQGEQGVVIRTLKPNAELTVPDVVEEEISGTASNAAVCSDPCDVNQDGKVDVLDMLYATSYFQLQCVPVGEIGNWLRVARVDGNEELNILDLLKIVSRIQQ
jgi:hypothetical protein